jgi:hypothetical protein
MLRAGGLRVTTWAANLIWWPLFVADMVGSMAHLTKSALSNGRPPRIMSPDWLAWGLFVSL